MPAELAVAYEEPDGSNLPSRSSLAKDLVLSVPCRRCSAAAPLHHRKFDLFTRATRSGHQRSRADTLPEVRTALKRKNASCCAELVIVWGLLWKFLQIAGRNK
jgi:hypothetical protein